MPLHGLGCGLGGISAMQRSSTAPEMVLIDLLNSASMGLVRRMGRFAYKFAEFVQWYADGPTDADSAYGFVLNKGVEGSLGHFQTRCR